MLGKGNFAKVSISDSLTVGGRRQRPFCEDISQFSDDRDPFHRHARLGGLCHDVFRYCST